MVQATRLLSSLVAAVPLAAAARAALEGRQGNATTTIPSRVEQGIQTECKTCPYSLCPNQLAFDYGTEMTLTCWTYGDNIVDSNIWLRTTDGCYVTQWDIVEYAGDYTNTPGFPYCGDIPKKYTTGPSATVYNTECNIIPQTVESQDHIRMYKPKVDLTLTCYTNQGESILDNPTWFKTLSNCYVPSAQIEPVDAGALDDCGPIPFMETKMRDPDPQPAAAASFPAVRPRGRPASSSSSSSPGGGWRRWLYLTQVGGDEANCTSEASSTSAVRRVLPFGDYIVVQCATYGAAPEDDQIYLLTDDFCWVNDTLTDPQLIDSEERSQRYPNCIDFVDTVV